MTISRQETGTLVVHQLDTLYAEQCCPECCAPCGVVRDLLDRGDLNEVVMWAPTELWRDSHWWRNGLGVDPWWLNSRWLCSNYPEGHKAE